MAISADELKDLAYLPGELALIDRGINEIKRPPYLTDMPEGQREECTAALTELIALYQERRRMCAATLGKLRAFLDSIDDPFIRDLFRLRYEEGRDWPDVCRITELHGFYYAPDSLRKMCRRCIERYNENGTEQNGAAATV